MAEGAGPTALVALVALVAEGAAARDLVAAGAVPWVAPFREPRREPCPPHIEPSPTAGCKYST